MSETKKFTSADMGFSAFLYFLSPDRFKYAEKVKGGRSVQFVFDDTMPKDGMDCSHLKDLYFSRESVQLRNAKDFADCYRIIAQHMVAAKCAAEGEQVRL
jgi:hypothetical protein